MAGEHTSGEAARRLPEISLKLLVVAGLFLLSILGFTYIAHEAVIGKKDLFDTKIFLFLSAHSSPPVIRFMKLFTYLGSFIFLFPAYASLICYLLFSGKTRLAINIAVIALTSTALMNILKQFFHRHRPDLPLIESLKSYSFPSGYALSSFIFSCTLIYLIWKVKISPLLKAFISLLLIFYAVLIGISRIVLNVHYATDVIASFCLGFVWVSLSFAILNKMKKLT